jgi:hypothetical protein
MNTVCRFCRQPIVLKEGVGWVHDDSPWYAMCGTYIDDDGNERGGRRASPGVRFP